MFGFLILILTVHQVHSECNVVSGFKIRQKRRRLRRVYSFEELILHQFCPQLYQISQSLFYLYDRLL